MDQPEDFKKLGINPERVEKWEDGRRTKTEEVGSEIWYFDGTMEDGTKYMVGFRPKSPEGMAKFEDSPHVNIYIKSPEGKEFRDDICYGAAEGSFSREQCDSKCGPHWCKGDFKQYDIHFEPVHVRYQAKSKILCLSQGVLCNLNSFIFIVRGSR